MTSQTTFPFGSPFNLHHFLKIGCLFHTASLSARPLPSRRKCTAPNLRFLTLALMAYVCDTQSLMYFRGSSPYNGTINVADEELIVASFGGTTGLTIEHTAESLKYHDLPHVTAYSNSKLRRRSEILFQHFGVAHFDGSWTRERMRLRWSYAPT